jgi:hypothetical protein
MLLFLLILIISKTGAVDASFDLSRSSAPLTKLSGTAVCLLSLPIFHQPSSLFAYCPPIPPSQWSHWFRLFYNLTFVSTSYLLMFTLVASGVPALLANIRERLRTLDIGRSKLLKPYWKQWTAFPASWCLFSYVQLDAHAAANFFYNIFYKARAIRLRCSRRPRTQNRLMIFLLYLKSWIYSLCARTVFFTSQVLIGCFFFACQVIRNLARPTLRFYSALLLHYTIYVFRALLPCEDDQVIVKYEYTIRLQGDPRLY